MFAGRGSPIAAAPQLGHLTIAIAIGIMSLEWFCIAGRSSESLCTTSREHQEPGILVRCVVMALVPSAYAVFHVKRVRQRGGVPGARRPGRRVVDSDIWRVTTRHPWRDIRGTTPLT